MKLYFAYGANLNHEGMRWRCPAAVAVQPFYLSDYRLAFSGVATIQPAPGEQVAGALWAITESCEAALDCFEGYPTMYRKEYLQVDGMEIMFYRMNSDPPWEPSTNYLATIADGYEDFGLPLEDLYHAVGVTQQESEAYDLHWKSPNPTDTVDDVLAGDPYLEHGHDLRWLHAEWNA